MSAPCTIVILTDEDGDEFPIRLPGVYRENAGGDVESARRIIEETPELNPNGELELDRIEYR